MKGVCRVTRWIPYYSTRTLTAFSALRNSAGLLMLLLGYMAGCERTLDPLDDRTPTQVLAESSRYMEIPLISAESVLGYRAGLDERYLKIVVDESQLQYIIGNARCQAVGAIPRLAEGIDPSGIESWWQPQGLEVYSAYHGELPSGRGEMVIIVDRMSEDGTVVYLYCMRP